MLKCSSAQVLKAALVSSSEMQGTQQNQTKMTMGLFLVHHLVLFVMGFMVLAQGKLKQVSSIQTCRNDSAAFFILGDSSVDCGDNTLFYPLIHSYLSLYACNGSDESTLIPHLLAEKMGMQNILPFYSQNGSIEGIKRGLNFGSAHATIMNHGSQSYQSVNQQLRQVFDSMQLLQLQLNEDRALSFIRSSIFYVSFGKDDFIEFFLRKASGTAKQSGSNQEFSHILANQMINVIRNLYDMNVRRIICMGILPLGCTPRVVFYQYNSTAHPHDDEDNAKGCVEEINVQVLEYNRELHEKISELHAELPDAQLIFCDIYQGLTNIINNPGQYGFEDVKNACCGLGKYGAEIGCLSKDMACEKEASHVWWDLYNPTKAVNTLLADSAWSNNPLQICRPMSIQEFFNASI